MEDSDQDKAARRRNGKRRGPIHGATDSADSKSPRTDTETTGYIIMTGGACLNDEKKSQSGKSNTDWGAGDAGCKVQGAC